MSRAVSERRGGRISRTTLSDKTSRLLHGWTNYFQVGTVNKAYRALDNYAAMRLRRWLRFKHKVRRSKGEAYPLSHLYESSCPSRVRRRSPKCYLRRRSRDPMQKGQSRSALNRFWILESAEI